MIDRHARGVILRSLKDSPAVTLVGARQAGKTTLARSLSDRYFDLEQPGDRTRLDVEWDTVCAGKPLVILDEAQAWPEVFPRLRGAIDADRKRNGKFLLLGSVSPALMTQVSESLAGRLALVELTPLLLNEMAAPNIRRHWLVGGYPDGGDTGVEVVPELAERLPDPARAARPAELGFARQAANRRAPAQDVRDRPRPNLERVTHRVKSRTFAHHRTIVPGLP